MKPLDLKKYFDWAKDWGESQNNLPKEDMLKHLQEDVETEIKSAVQGLIESVKFNLYHEGWNDEEVEQFLDETVRKFLVVSSEQVNHLFHEG